MKRRTTQAFSAAAEWFRREAKSWAVPFLLLILWQAAAQFGWIEARVLPSPLNVLRAGVALWRNGTLPEAILVSSQRAFAGFFIGASIGLALGFLNGMFGKWETFLDGTLQMLRNVPHLALIPLVILWFGIGEEAKLFLVVLGVFFPVYSNTFHGVRSIDVKLKEMAGVYGLSHWQRFAHVIVPGALPSALVGLRYSLGFMWLTLIVAETIAATRGIGYITMNAREFMQTDVVVLGILVYALLGKWADWLARVLESSLLRWRPSA